MPKPDLRAQLVELAAGRDTRTSPRATVDASVVNAHQADFIAWHAFALPTAGEAITAPADLLTPLP